MAFSMNSTLYGSRADSDDDILRRCFGGYTRRSGWSFVRSDGSQSEYDRLRSDPGICESFIDLSETLNSL